MVPIRQNLVSSNKYNIKCPYTMVAEGITVHNTSNKAPAKNEINYMINNNKQVSFHYAVDDIEIIQGIPENRNAFHAGDGNGKGNRKTIGIEICYSTGDKAKFEKAQENAAEFIASKLKEKGWGTDRVYPHKHWSGKHCPHRTLDEYGWDYFISLINKYLNGATPIQPTTKIDIIYQTWDDVENTWLPNVTNNSDYAGLFGDDVCAVYANLTSGDCIYKVHTEKGSWLPEVKNREDYAGMYNRPIDGFMIKATNPNVQIYYQVHTRGGSWLPYVTGYSESDHDNGYAGILGKPIDGIRMYVEVRNTPTPQPVQPEPIPQPVKPVEYFRIRTSWEDVDSQQGAYTSLDNAIKKCQSIGEGYNVYDSEGKMVYSYIKPEPTPIEPQPVEPIDPTEPKIDPVEPEDLNDSDNTLPEINKNWLANLMKMIVEVLLNLFGRNKNK